MNHRIWLLSISCFFAGILLGAIVSSVSIASAFGDKRLIRLDSAIQAVGRQADELKATQVDLVRTADVVLNGEAARPSVDATPPWNPQAKFPPRIIKAVEVVDGDTFDAGGVRYRVAYLDAPASRKERGGPAPCEAEKRLGMLASDYASKLFAEAKRIEVTPTGKVQPASVLGKRREHAVVSIDGADFGEAMIASGFARRGDVPQSLWCQITLGAGR